MDTKSFSVLFAGTEQSCSYIIVCLLRTHYISYLDLLKYCTQIFTVNDGLFGYLGEELSLSVVTYKYRDISDILSIVCVDITNEVQLTWKLSAIFPSK